MRLYKYLTELFQEKKDFKIWIKETEYFTAAFEVDGKEWRFIAEWISDDSNWELIFEDKKSELEITGLAKENVIEVFSYIITLTKYFLREYNPEKVKFSGFELKQQKLYQKLVKRYSKEIEKLGYKVEDRGEFEDIAIKRTK